MNKAIKDVIAERKRQIEKEGWTPDHDDDEHRSGDLALAGAAYAIYDAGDRLSAYTNQVLFDLQPHAKREPIFWPFHYDWWKPKGRRRNLVRAAALIVAEIERLDRAALADEGV